MSDETPTPDEPNGETPQEPDGETPSGKTPGDDPAAQAHAGDAAGPATAAPIDLTHIETVEVDYLAPLERSFERMKAILFSPFDPAKWFVLGFACWLARLAHGGNIFSWGFHGGGGGGSAQAAPVGDGLVSTLAGAAGRFDSFARGFLQPERWEGDFWTLPIALTAAGCVVVLLLGLMVLLTWLSARGQLVFYDDVLHNRAAIEEPWRRTRAQGNSLFRWHLGLLAVAFACFMLIMTPLWVTLLAEPEAPAIVTSVILIVCLGVLGAVFFSYVQLFLVHFVVPIMHRYGETTSAAWRRFMPIFRRRPWPFLAYGIVMLLLHLLAGAAVVAIGFLTCCVGWLILAIPYIGTVVLLPFYVTLRAYGIEFFGQFMPEIRFPEWETEVAARSAQ